MHTGIIYRTELFPLPWSHICKLLGDAPFANYAAFIRGLTKPWSGLYSDWTYNHQKDLESYACLMDAPKKP